MSHRYWPMLQTTYLGDRPVHPYHRYHVNPGRLISKDGRSYITIIKEYGALPAEADELTHVIADYLNALESGIKPVATAEPKPVVAVYIDAGRDRNGNPRRGWIVYDETGRVDHFVDEGYRGSAARPTGVPDMEALKITPGEYRRLKKKEK